MVSVIRHRALRSLFEAGMLVSGNWRLIFEWQDGVAEELDLVDYH
jgi:plasmid maintenance system killer protein